MSEAPILILLGCSAASAGAGDARGQDGDMTILGLSLVRRAILAARRAGYGQVLLLRGNDRGTLGPAAIADWRSASSHPAPLIIAPASILAENDWLERLASTKIEPAAWGGDPEPGRRALRRLGAGGAGRGGYPERARTGRSRGSARPVARAPGAPSRGDRSDACRDVRRRSGRGAAPAERAGQGHRRVHGAPCRAAGLLADFAPPRGDRDHAQPNEPDLDCGRNLRRAVFPVRPAR